MWHKHRRRSHGGNSGGGGIFEVLPTPTSLLHFDGTDLSQTFTDEAGLVWGVTGVNAKLSTTSPKFGTASLYTPSASISTASAAVWDFAGGDFVVDMWIKWSGQASGNYLYHKGLSSGFAPVSVQLSSLGKISMYWSFNGVAFQGPIASANGAIVSNGTWQHVEFGRSGNTWYLFVDGVLIGSTVSAGTLYTNATPQCLGGTLSSPDDTSFNGYIDEFRAVKGSPPHTTGFTPRTSAYVYP